MTQPALYLKIDRVNEGNSNTLRAKCNIYYDNSIKEVQFVWKSFAYSMLILLIKSNTVFLFVFIVKCVMHSIHTFLTPNSTTCGGDSTPLDPLHDIFVSFIEIIILELLHHLR